MVANEYTASETRFLQETGFLPLVALPQKGVWNFQALKNSSIYWVGEFQTPFLGLRSAGFAVRRAFPIIQGTSVRLGGECKNS